MKKEWRTAGLVILGAAVLTYPAMLLYKYVAKKLEEKDEDGEHHIFKAFAPSLRGKHKPHHRHNGDVRTAQS